MADLHVWRLGPGHLGAIVSIMTAKPRNAEFYRSRLSRFRMLSHVTIEVGDKSFAARRPKAVLRPQMTGMRKIVRKTCFAQENLQTMRWIAVEGASHAMLAAALILIGFAMMARFA